MTKTEAKQKAKDVLIKNLAVAYYKVCDDKDIDYQDEALIIKYINKYGMTMAKSIGREYFTF